MKEAIYNLRRRLRPVKTPEALEWDDWDSWENHYRSNHPLAYFIYETVPMWFGRRATQVGNAWWWVRHRVDPRHRYHIVGTGLKPGYYDKDTLLLHACFDLLKRFVERERPFEHFAIDESPNKDGWAIIGDLYHWWTIDRPARDKRRFATVPPAELTDEDYEIEHEVERAYYAEDNLMLHRLIDVRGQLWT